MSYRYFLEGEIDVATAPDVLDAILQTIELRPIDVIFDFVDVTFMDCAGVRVLVELNEVLATHGRQLELANLARAARLPIDVLGLAGTLGLS